MPKTKPRPPSRVAKPIVRVRDLKDAFTEEGRSIRKASFHSRLSENTLSKVLHGDVSDMTVRSLMKVADFYDLRVVIEITNRFKEAKDNVKK